MVLPAIEARGFPGKREEAKRAGTTPKILPGTYDSSSDKRSGHPLAQIDSEIGPFNVLFLIGKR
jgi:hypothetical protein